MNSAPTAYSPGLGQREAEPVRLLGEELVRDLHQDAGAVAGARIGADRAAVLEVAQDGERVLDQLVRLAALDVGDEADAAGILVERRDRRGPAAATRPDRRYRRSARRASAAARSPAALRPTWLPRLRLALIVSSLVLARPHLPAHAGAARRSADPPARGVGFAPLARNVPR